MVTEQQKEVLKQRLVDSLKTEKGTVPNRHFWFISTCLGRSSDKLRGQILDSRCRIRIEDKLRRDDKVGGPAPGGVGAKWRTVTELDFWC